MSMIISSQTYIDEDIVSKKQADRDYTVTLSPEFSHAGLTLQVVLDGHHSLAAAKLDCVEPDYIIATRQQNDTIAILDYSTDEFLAACWMGEDWYSVETGRRVWA